MKILLSVITVNYNGLEDTCELIDSITFSDNMEVIVVDNGSHGDEASTIEGRYPRVQVVRSKENLGFAGGNNLGIKAAQGKYLLFINNDTVVGSCSSLLSYLSPLVARMESSPSIGVVCPKIRFYWAPQPLQFAGYTPLSHVTLRNNAIGCGEDDNGQYDQPRQTPYAHGAAMMVRRETVDRVGMMPENYFLYYEELDWSMMIRRGGYEIWYDPAVTIYHKESQTTGQDSPLRTYYIARNRLLLARRNIAAPKRYLTYIYLIMAVGTRDILKYTLQRRTGNARAVVKGMADFIRGRQGKMQ